MKWYKDDDDASWNVDESYEDDGNVDFNTNNNDEGGDGNVDVNTRNDVDEGPEETNNITEQHSLLLLTLLLKWVQDRARWKQIKWLSLFVLGKKVITRGFDAGLKVQ